MTDSKMVKEILFGLGADLCGIASMDRFANAPKGHHPLDVLPTCKSVISFGCRFPVGARVLQFRRPLYEGKEFHYSQKWTQWLWTFALKWRSAR